MRPPSSARDAGSVREAHRIVAFTTDIADALLALGGRDRLVGTSSIGPAVDGVARMGTQVAPDEAALAAARPDLVFVADGPIGAGVLDRRPAGSSIEALSFDDRAHFADAVRRIARRLGRPGAAGQLLERIDGELDAVRRSTTGPRPRVVALLRRDPMVVAGPGSFVDELLEIAGARNTVANTSHLPFVDPAMIAAWNPEIVLDLTAPEDAGVESALPGLAAHRIVTVGSDGMLRPGPRSGEAARRLAAALHPAR